MSGWYRSEYWCTSPESSPDSTMYEPSRRCLVSAETYGSSSICLTSAHDLLTTSPCQQLPGTRFGPTTLRPGARCHSLCTESTHPATSLPSKRSNAQPTIPSRSAQVAIAHPGPASPSSAATWNTPVAAPVSPVSGVGSTAAGTPPSTSATAARSTAPDEENATADTAPGATSAARSTCRRLPASVRSGDPSTTSRVSTATTSARPPPTPA